MRWREGIGVFILAFSFQVFHFGSFYPLHCMLVNGILKKEHMFFAAVVYETFNSFDFGGVKKAGSYGEDEDR